MEKSDEIIDIRLWRQELCKSPTYSAYIIIKNIEIILFKTNFLKQNFFFVLKLGQLRRGVTSHKAGFPSVKEKTRCYGCFSWKMCVTRVTLLGGRNDLKPPIRDICNEKNA